MKMSKRSNQYTVYSTVTVASNEDLQTIEHSMPRRKSNQPLTPQPHQHEDLLGTEHIMTRRKSNKPHHNQQPRQSYNKARAARLSEILIDREYINQQRIKRQGMISSRRYSGPTPEYVDQQWIEYIQPSNRSIYGQPQELQYVGQKEIEYIRPSNRSKCRVAQELQHVDQQEIEYIRPSNRSKCRVAQKLQYVDQQEIEYIRPSNRSKCRVAQELQHVDQQEIECIRPSNRLKCRVAQELQHVDQQEIEYIRPSNRSKCRLAQKLQYVDQQEIEYIRPSNRSKCRVAQELQHVDQQEIEYNSESPDENHKGVNYIQAEIHELPDYIRWQEVIYMKDERLCIEDAILNFLEPKMSSVKQQANSDVTEEFKERKRAIFVHDLLEVVDIINQQWFAYNNQEPNRKPEEHCILDQYRVDRIESALVEFLEKFNYGGFFGSLTPEVAPPPAAAASSSKPPPSPPRGGSTWEFLNPFQTYEDYYPPHTPSMNSEELREEEGIPDLEDEEEVLKEVQGHMKFVDEGGGSRGGDDYPRPRPVDVEKGKEKEVINDSEVHYRTTRARELMEDDAVEYEVHMIDKKVVVDDKDDDKSGGHRPGFKSFGDDSEAVKEIQAHQFERASELGNELSKMLEIGKLPHNRKHAAYQAVSSKMLNVIAPSLSIVSSDASSAKPSLGYDDTVGLSSTNLSSTLQKLFLWEKKLYQEVKSEEKLRVQHERKSRKLKRPSK